MPDIENISLRMPRLEDGMAVHGLISNCPPLDTNSSYCNLLQCSHFASTSVSAWLEDRLVGFISCYVLPEKQDTLFIWQVAVSKDARGRGLSSKMLTHILNRPNCRQIKCLEMSIAEDNQPSWNLFKSFAKKHDAKLQSSEWMDKSQHFAGQHESELLVRVGPFSLNH